jgi:hypothetical protein
MHIVPAIRKGPPSAGHPSDWGQAIPTETTSVSSHNPETRVQNYHEMQPRACRAKTPSNMHYEAPSSSLGRGRGLRRGVRRFGHGFDWEANIVRMPQDTIESSEKGTYLHSFRWLRFLLVSNDLTSDSRSAAIFSLVRHALGHAPVENVVVLITFANEEIAEEFAKVGIVGFVIEAEGTTVVQKDAKLVGETSAKEIGGGSHFFLHDTIVFLLLGCCLQPLPRELTTQKVHENIGERFQIITSGLLCSKS